MTEVKKFVLTGGPGVGKSTLLKVLADKGLYTIAEVATYIIENELEKNPKSEILPWKNKDAFQRKVLETQLEWEATPEKLNAETTLIRGEDGRARKASLLEKEIETVIQDRGIADGIAYYLIDGQEAPGELLEAARNAGYAGIFLLEPVTYKQTKVRREDPETARKLHEKIREVYESLGYKPISIPALNPEERAEMILNIIKQN
ncbi:ATP-binding protein [Candidatus Pacearchaeota archaeon]|nr:ATP-binding protein [Candidatus Pacearchaeota archaeon]